MVRGKPFEADMRHLLNTYIQADAATDLGDLGALSLTALIIQTGIHDAIARKLNERRASCRTRRLPKGSSTTSARPSSATN